MRGAKGAEWLKLAPATLERLGFTDLDMDNEGCVSSPFAHCTWCALYGLYGNVCPFGLHGNVCPFRLHGICPFVQCGPFRAPSGFVLTRSIKHCAHTLHCVAVTLGYTLSLCGCFDVCRDAGTTCRRWIQMHQEAERQHGRRTIGLAPSATAMTWVMKKLSEVVLIPQSHMTTNSAQKHAKGGTGGGAGLDLGRGAEPNVEFDPARMWQCMTCTFLNELAVAQCIMCERGQRPVVGAPVPARAFRAGFGFGLRPELP
jgi:hypothetical protein